MPFDVVTFGETMIRLSPPDNQRLEDTSSLEMRIGGSESNTAVALAQLGRPVAWWSKLVDNPLGRRVAADIRRWGVDCCNVIWTDSGRTGVYFIEIGVPPRPHSVTYDRAGSAASTLAPDEVDWNHLNGCKHMHLTGITSALSALCSDTVLRAANEAKTRGLTVSLDVNYRAKLWTPDEACRALTAIMPSIDLLMCASGDAGCVFNISGEPPEIAGKLRSRFGVETVVVTAGDRGAAGLNNDGVHCISAFDAVDVDRVGSGDAFDAGLLDGFLDGDLERGLRLGAAMAALKRTVPGDHLIATRSEIEELVAGASLGIRR